MYFGLYTKQVDAVRFRVDIFGATMLLGRGYSGASNGESIPADTGDRQQWLIAKLQLDIPFISREIAPMILFIWPR